MKSKSSGKPRQKPCPGCGGSGQTAYFGGESRFMLTWEDCPDCHGTGIILADNAQEPSDDPSHPQNS